MALDESTREWLTKRFTGLVCFDEPMARHTSFRVGGPVDALVYPKSQEDVVALMTGAWERKIRYMVVGDGTNLLVPDRGMSGIAINLGKYMNRIRILETGAETIRLYVEAGARTKSLCRFCLGKGFRGMNFALGIPGTLGGAIRMNAGTGLGWMSDVLRYVEVVYPMGKPKKIPKEELTTGYRKLSWVCMTAAEECYPPVLLGGCVEVAPGDKAALRKEAKEIVRARRGKQPVSGHSAGCFFKNPDPKRSAGWLIEQAGLKGCRCGGAMVSKKHANFILNTGTATSEEIFTLVRTIQETVFEKFQVMLEPEVQVVSEEADTQE